VIAYYSATHCHLGDVVVGNVTFMIFAVFDVSLTTWRR